MPQPITTNTTFPPSPHSPQLFDVGQPSVPLRDLIREERVPVRGKRAFVPGCGRGYDVIAFAEGGASAAVGLELSGTAIAAAEAHRDGLKLPAEVAAKARFVAGNFLTWSDGQFDVGYDYTFLCALHPSMRKDWADAWARHLAPGGRLITMIYPVDPSMDANSGPPWPVTPQLYDSLLPAAGFEREVLEPVPPAASLGTRGGKELFAIWRRI